MRRQRLLGFTAVAAFALLIGHGIAAAQAQGVQQPPVDTNAGITRQVNLSPQDMAIQVEASLTRMDAARATVRRMLETARAQRDVVKTLCLNDKLNQLDVAIRSVRERKLALDAAAQRKDTDLASHEYTIASVLRQRADQLTAEANQCIGQEVGTVGDNTVSATIDPGIVKDEPFPWNEPSPAVIVEPPAAVSFVK